MISAVEGSGKVCNRKVYAALGVIPIVAFFKAEVSRELYGFSRKVRLREDCLILKRNISKGEKRKLLELGDRGNSILLRLRIVP